MASLLLVPLVIVLVPAGAQGSGIVDAGESVRVRAGTPFGLEGRFEGFTGPVTLSWTAPAGCTVDAPGEVAVVAQCASVGIHAFTFSATDGASSASDAVNVLVFREVTQVLVSATGATLAGAPDELAQYEGIAESSGAADGATVRVPFTVPAGLASMEAHLEWDAHVPAPVVSVNDYDLDLAMPGGERYPSDEGLTASMPERILVGAPAAGAWEGVIMPFAVANDEWLFVVFGNVVEGDAPFPSILVPRATATPGEPVTLTAEVAGGTAPHHVAWETSLGSVAFDDGAGASFTFTFASDTTVKAKVTDASGFERVAYAFVRAQGAGADHPFTVVGVIDGSFSPYHYDFLGHQHPWNRDADAANDFDFTQDPATYLDGHPGATPIPITVPQSPSEAVGGYRNGQDAGAWGQFRSSSLSGGVNLYWFPGTKIVGAARFGNTEFYGSNDAHGTRSAASAAGNWKGACEECVFVLIAGTNYDALKWASLQPWIDVLTNSYGHSVVGGPVRDNVYFGAPVGATRAASEAGQTIVFSAGNGLLNAFDAPMFTYWSSQKGPDWMVTVGAVSPTSGSTYTGAGKPVDISSVGSSYPSTGGTTANGTGTHSGTSNAAPVTAGYFGKVIQEARTLLADTTVQHAGGIVASGTPVACGSANAACPLGDGVLTHEELRDLVFHNTLPSPQRISAGTIIPTTPLAYYYQGHGTLFGKLTFNSQVHYEQEWRRMVDAAKGDVLPHARPAGETNWMIVDSKCRQRLWGAWSGGYYDGASEPALDPAADPIAISFNAGCSQLPHDAFWPVMGVAGDPDGAAAPLPFELPIATGAAPAVPLTIPQAPFAGHADPE